MKLDHFFKKYVSHLCCCVRMRKGKKCANLVNLSTTTKMVSFPYALGNPPMKSIDMSDHTSVGIGRGWSNSAGAKVSALLR